MRTARAEVRAFASTPLEPINLRAAVVTHTRAQRGLPQLAPRLPFDLTRHPAAQSDLAGAMLARLEEDMKQHAASENAASLPTLACFSRAEIAACFGSATATAALLKQAELLADRLTQLQRRAWRGQ